MKLLFLLSALVALSAAQVCTDCPSCEPKVNPTFPLADSTDCSAKVVFILDESGSLRNFREDVVAAATAFWTGLANLNTAGGSASLGLIEFATDARVVQPTLRPLDNAYLTELNAYINSQAGGISGYSPIGTTDWGAALSLVNSEFTGSNTPDIVVFFTDGEPNGHEPAICDATCYSFDQNNGDLGHSCFVADQIKARGIKIFTVAVGDVVGNVPAIQVISGGSVDSTPFGAGASEWDFQASTFGTADYLLRDDLTTLPQVLAQVAAALCPQCESCAVFPTNNNPEQVECTGKTRPTFLPITFTTTGQCGTPVLGETVTGFTEGATCNVGTVTQTLSVLDECDQESERTASFTTRVVDTRGPSIECPASGNGGTCAEALERINALQAEATDLCSQVFVDKSEVRTIREENTLRGYEVTFTAFDGCENSAETPCVVQLTCSDGADLELIKSSNIEDCAIAGDSEKDVRYTIRVTNDGNEISRNVVVTDNYPTNGVLERRGAITVTVGDVVETDTGFTWTIGDMAPGAVATIQFRFELASSFPQGIMENYAIAESPTPDPDLCNNEDRDYIRVCHVSDLEVTKTDNELQVTAGELVGDQPKLHVYEITVTNNGVSDANNVRLVDEFPAGFTLVATQVGNDGACFTSSTGFHCRWSNVPAGESRTVLATYTVPSCTEAGPQINTVHVSSDSTDPNTENNHASDTTWVRTEADVAVTKDDEVDDVTAGDGQVYTYSIRVSNNGPSCAREVRLVDIWPEGIVPVEGTLQTSQGSCSANRLPAGSFSCNVGQLEPGQVVRVSVQYTVPSDTQECDIHNVVNAISTTYDPNTCNNDASDTNAVLERAELRVTKFANVDEIEVGDVTPYEYTIEVYNYGPSTARQVQLTDIWPSCFTQFKGTLKASQGGCVTTGGDFSCALGSIPAGFQVVVRLQFTLSEQVLAGRVCHNSANAFSPTDGVCRHDDDTILVVEELKKRSDSSLAIEHIALSAVSVSLVDEARTLTLNMTNTHGHAVVVQQVVVDGATLDAGVCAGEVAADKSRVCTLQLPEDKAPRTVYITGTGKDAATPLEAKAVVNAPRPIR